MAIAGILLIIFGIVDFGGSYMGIDVWGGWLGIQLPDLLWEYSALIEIAIGSVLLNMGGSGQEE